MEISDAAEGVALLLRALLEGGLVAMDEIAAGGVTRGLSLAW